MKHKLGDRVVVIKQVGCDQEYEVKEGDVAKVVFVDDDGDVWCYNPKWIMANEEKRGNFMREDQVKKIW